jgi:hypothetical protein
MGYEQGGCVTAQRLVERVRAGVVATVTVLLLFATSACSERGSIVGVGQPTTDESATPLVSPLASDEPRYRMAAPPDPAALTIPDAGYYGWVLLDRGTGGMTGSPNAATEGSTVESMIKPWIVADFLRRLAEDGQRPSDQVLNELTLVLIDSNDPLAESYYQQGGADGVVRRLIDICGLTDVRIDPGLWWSTWMNPVDAARYGQCIADGRGAGPQWTPWLLDTMRQVRGGVDEQYSGERQGGRWGIIDGLPPELAAEVTIKNGYTDYVDGWHVNCLAIHEDWVLAIMLRSWAGLRGGAEGCAIIARGLVVRTGR